MRKRTAIVTRQIIGGLLVIFGVFGLALPLLQGVLMLVVGLYILSLDSTWFRSKIHEWTAKDVRVAEIFRKVDRRIRHFFGMHDGHVHDQNHTHTI